MPNSADSKPVVPVLTGPTGSGKTGLALKLLEIHSGIHIISSDSRQIYKRLNIGTDKPPIEQLNKYNFHLTGFIVPGERYTAFDFVEDAERLLDELITQDSSPPLICGGTGLYIKSLVDGIVEIPDDDFSIREKMEDDAVRKGPEFLFKKLEQVDPEEASKVHPHNIKKIIRALEIFYLTGKTKTEMLTNASHRKPDYNFIMFCLTPLRDELYDKINKRVDLMIEEGLLDEVEHLYKSDLKEKVEQINVIGYNELFKYFDGELSLDSAVNLIKQNSRRFAKKQITWFKGMKDLEFISSREEAFERLITFWK